MPKARKSEKKRMGRPPRTDDPRPLTIIVPAKIKRWLAVYAVRANRTMGDVVATALAEYRDRQKKK